MVLLKVLSKEEPIIENQKTDNEKHKHETKKN